MQNLLYLALPRLRCLNIRLLCYRVQSEPARTPFPIMHDNILFKSGPAANDGTCRADNFTLSPLNNAKARTVRSYHITPMLR